MNVTELADAIDRRTQTDETHVEVSRLLLTQASHALRRLGAIEAALIEAESVLALCTTRTFAAPEDAEVRRLGERIGFGALISSASKGWADVLRERYPEAVGGQHTGGPCEATVKRALEMIRAALRTT